MPTKRQLSKMRESDFEYFPLKVFNENTGAITEAAHSANTMLGEVCPHCGKPLTAESSGADSSETGDVRQNLGQLKDGGTTDG